jgi:hypothetical protein
MLNLSCSESDPTETCAPQDCCAEHYDAKRFRPRTGPERRIPRWEQEHLLEAVQQRLDANPQAMRQRRETVEHPFGTMKARMGATHFLTKRFQGSRRDGSIGSGLQFDTGHEPCRGQAADHRDRGLNDQGGRDRQPAAACPAEVAACTGEEAAPVRSEVDVRANAGLRVSPCVRQFVCAVYPQMMQSGGSLSPPVRTQATAIPQASNAATIIADL